MARKKKEPATTTPAEECILLSEQPIVPAEQPVSVPETPVDYSARIIELETLIANLNARLEVLENIHVEAKALRPDSITVYI